MTTTGFVIAPALGVPLAYYRPLRIALRDEIGAMSELAPLPTLRPGILGWMGLRSPGLEGFLDAISAAAKTLRSRGACRVILLGHSVGGQMGVVAAAQSPELFDGVVLVASGTPYWRAWPAAERPGVRAGIVFIATILRLLPWYPGRLLGFGGTQPRRLMRQWVGMALTGNYRHFAQGAQYEQSMRDLSIPALAINIDGDELAPPSATDFLLAKLPRVEAQRNMAGTTVLAGVAGRKRHVAWVREPLCVTPHIRRWLASRRGGAEV